jgi:hypothetical protein
MMALIFTISGCASKDLFYHFLYEIGTDDDHSAQSYDSYKADRQTALSEIERDVNKEKEEARVKKLQKQANEQTREITKDLETEKAKTDENLLKY